MRYSWHVPQSGAAGAGGYRLRAAAEAGLERFEDALLGPQVQDPQRSPETCSSGIASGQWTYQFAVTVDDIDQRIDLVIRGEDLLASTGRQIRLARLLGRMCPPSSCTTHCSTGTAA